jgi:hypothetical protein
MDGDRIERALARIEAASQRIEAASARPAAGPNGHDLEIQGRYDALRSEAGAALAELDRLLGALDR